MKKQNHCSVIFFYRKKPSVSWLKSMMYWFNSSLTIFYNVSLRFLRNNIQFCSIWYVRGITWDWELTLRIWWCADTSECPTRRILHPCPPCSMSKTLTYIDHISEFHISMWYNPFQKDRTGFNFEKRIPKHRFNYGCLCTC